MINRALATTLLLCLRLQPHAASLGSRAPARISVAPAADSAPSARDGQRDFDFEIGTWTIHVRRRVHPLSSDTTWVSPEGYTHIVQRVWDGRASLAQLANDRPTPHFDGLMLRMYNAQSHQWSIYWGSAKSAALDAPLVGEFTNGRGVFYNEDTFEGRHLFVRLVYSDITPTSFRTESSYSADGGKTWEPTLIQTFTRVELQPKGVVQLPPDLAQAIREFDEGQTHNDVAALARLVTDDFVLVNSDASVENKQQYLADFNLPGFKIDPYVREQVVEKVMGDAAVIAALVHLSFTQDGKHQTRELRIAYVWAKRDGRWQATYAQVTRVPQ